MVFVGCGFLLWGKLATMDGAAILDALATITLGSYAIAACATWLSLRAVGQYDAIWHRILNTGIPPHRATRSGTCAIAIAQVVGFGALSAGVVRRRMLPHLSLTQITAISTAVPLSFLICWAGYAVIAGWWLGHDTGFTGLWAVAASLIATIAITLFVRHRPHILQRFGMSRLFKLMGWTGADMICAAAALYFVLPAGVDIGFTTVLAAYILALGAGLLANSPGGVGAFDLVLLSLLDSHEDIVVALILFRVIYYAVPAVFAGFALLADRAHLENPVQSPAHWNLARQSGAIQRIADWTCFSVDAGGFRAALGGQHREFDLTAFARTARSSAKCPILYNCSARHAAQATRAGWYLRRTTMEALIRTDTWSLRGSSRQSLRRKLRAAVMAGVHICEMAPHDMPDLPAIARAWATTHGGEMGCSMGRFTPEYIATQRVFLIKCYGMTQGFVTFHAGTKDWHLDLIRYRAGLPDGAIHAAIVAAITAARRNNVAILSLSTVPDPRYTPPIWADRRRGLTQFKRCFAPVWVPRYHAAPNRIAFWISGCMLALAIHRPIANLPWKVLQWIKLLPLELKFWPKRDKRRVQHNQRRQKS
jgi:phosphatidylglycerol lysyltransferase